MGEPALDLILRGAFTPASLSGLVLWLDATRDAGTDGAAFVPADYSGLGNAPSQATGTKQPLYRASGINGKPAADYDGTDDFVACASLTKTQIPTTGDATFACVFQLDGGLGASRLILSIGNGGFTYTPNFHFVGLMMLSNDTLVFNGYDGSEHRAVSNSALTTGVTYIAIGVRESGTNKLYLNGVLQTTTAAAGTPNVNAAATLRIAAATDSGAGANLNGRIAQGVVYNRPLNAGQAGQIFRYWNARYAAA